MQKINDLSLFSHPQLVEKAEEYCTTRSDWILKESESKWVECFKKSSNLESKENPMGKDHECKKPPFTSEKLLKMIQTKGGVRCVLKYMDYLTLYCNVKDPMLHTRYGTLQIQFIRSILAKKYPADASQPEDQGEEPESADSSQAVKFNFEAASADSSLIELRNKLRNFLISSNFYELTSIEYFLQPLSEFLNKELAIFKMR